MKKAKFSSGMINQRINC